MKKLTPAQCVVKAFGGVRPTARALGKVPSAVMWWLAPKSGGKGTGGRVPSKAQQAILALAKRGKVKITAEELVSGKSVRG